MHARALVLTALIAACVSSAVALAVAPIGTPRVEAQVASTPTATPTAGPEMSERERIVARAAQLPEMAYDELAVERARVYLSSIFGEEGIARGEVELRPSPDGWMVIFHDVNVDCQARRRAEGRDYGLPDECRFGARPDGGSNPRQDVFACLERGTWAIRGLNGVPDRLGPEDRCAGMWHPRSRGTLAAGTPIPAAPTVPPGLLQRPGVATPTVLPSLPVPPHGPPPGMTDEQWVAQVARTYLMDHAGGVALPRSRLELRPYTDGWMVIFRDLEASCAQGYWWPAWCRYLAPLPALYVWQDVFFCFTREYWSPGGLHGGSPGGVGPENECAPAQGAVR